METKKQRMLREATEAIAMYHLFANRWIVSHSFALSVDPKELPQYIIVPDDLWVEWKGILSEKEEEEVSDAD